MRGSPTARAGETTNEILAFLIADIRGYSTFNRERGDADAAKLASRFADVARDAVEARAGRVVELRGDEVLAVFSSPSQAVCASVELQAACAEETAEDPSLPLPIGIGIDAGPAVPVEGGYRGVAINMAARLCAKAGAGEVLITDAFAAACTNPDGITYTEAGTFEFKGFADPVAVVAATMATASLAPTRMLPVARDPLPPELDAFTPIVGRQLELSWIRGAWRIARRGAGRLVFVSGPAGVGKTRLVAELAAEIAARASGHVRYAGPGGAAAANALSALRATTTATEPTLIVLDDLDSLGDAVLNQLALSGDRVEELPVLIVGISRDPTSLAALSTLIEREDVETDGHRTLGPLGSDAVGEIAGLYIEDPTDLPVDAMLKASGGLPGRLHELVIAWARDEANRRVEAAAEWLTAGRGELRRTELRLASNAIGLKLARLYAAGEAGAATDVDCPYRGLASFGADDASYFFGRERLVGELAARLVGTGMLGVVGASGSGKSSVVAAGLLPSLAAGLLPGSERWRHVAMRPGDRPMAALGTALGANGGGPGMLTQAIDRLGSRGRLILVVDQFEEIFTACADEEARSAFVEALTTAATSAPERLGVVVAVRGDLYERCSAYPALAELLGSTQVLVGPMTPDELRRAVELPARRAGLRVEAALTDALIGEVTDEPGGLPLLSTALLELWQAREDGWLRLDAYEATGGVTGAVARLAEAAYGALDAEEQEAAKAILLRLAGQGDDQGVVRRRAPLAEFDVDSHPEVERAMTVLIADRLLTVGEGRVEVAHEALLREWPRLRGWLEEDAEGRAVQRNLIAAAGQWDTGGRDDAELYRGAKLGAVLDFTSQHGRDLNELERSFVAQSREASEQDSRRIRRTNRRLRGLLIGVALFLVVALVAGSLALVQRGRAQRSATVALSQSLGAEAVAEPQLDTALLLAEEGMHLDDSLQTESDLLTVFLDSPSAINVIHAGSVGASPQALAVSPDGRTLAVVNGDRRLWFYDAMTGQPIGRPINNVPPTGYRLPAFTPDGSEIAVLRGAGVQMIDVRTHRVVRTIRIGMRADDVLSPVLLSPDGRVAYLQVGERVAAWDTSTSRRVANVAVPGLGGQMLALAPRTGQVVTLTTQRGGRIQIRDGATLAVERWFPVPLPAADFSYALAVSPDGQTGAYTWSDPGADPSLRFVDLRTGHVTVGNGAQAGGDFVAVSPDGRTAISVSDDYLHISVWDVASATLVQTLSGHSGAIESAAFDPSGRTLYSAGDDGNVFAWDLSGSRGFGRSFTASPGSWGGPCWGHHAPYFSASPDGNSIAVPYAPQHGEGGVSKGGSVNIVDLATGRVTTRVRVVGRVAGIASVIYAEFSPDGTELLVSPGPSSNGDITLWRLDGRTASLVRTFSGLTATPAPQECGFFAAPWATFSPDGKWIAGVDRRESGDARMIEWNADTGAERAAPLNLRWKSTDGAVSQNVVYSPDGSLIATSVLGNRTVIVDARTLKPVQTLPDPHGVAFVAFSPTNNGLLAEGSSDAGIVRLWDVTTHEQIAEVSASTTYGSWSAQFDSAGTMLLTDNSDGVARLWSVPGLQQIGPDLPGEPSYVGAAAFAGQGASTTAVLVYASGHAFAYPASPSAWERQACVVAGRNFTQAEWDLYLPGRPYSEVCLKDELN